MKFASIRIGNRSLRKQSLSHEEQNTVPGGEGSMKRVSGVFEVHMRKAMLI